MLKSGSAGFRLMAEREAIMVIEADASWKFLDWATGSILNSLWINSVAGQERQTVPLQQRKSGRRKGVRTQTCINDGQGRFMLKVGLEALNRLCTDVHIAVDAGRTVGQMSPQLHAADS